MDGKHFGRAGVRAKKLQIVVARGLLLANIRAPFPDSGFGAQKTARLVGSLAEKELGPLPAEAVFRVAGITDWWVNANRGERLQVENLRYSRLKVCGTKLNKRI